jgi:hypothetical protein
MGGKVEEPHDRPVIEQLGEDGQTRRAPVGFAAEMQRGPAVSRSTKYPTACRRKSPRLDRELLASTKKSRERTCQPRRLPTVSA